MTWVWLCILSSQSWSYRAAEYASGQTATTEEPLIASPRNPTLDMSSGASWNGCRGMKEYSQ